MFSPDFSRNHEGLAFSDSTQPEFLEAILHFFQVEFERTEFFQFAFLEMARRFRVVLKLFEKIGIVTTGMFYRPLFSWRSSALFRKPARG